MGYSNENYRLGGWDFETLAAAWIFARQNVVNTDHVIARFLKLRAGLFVHPARWQRLLSAHEPAHIIVSSLAAGRAGKVGRFNFLLLVEKITFFHWAFIVSQSRGFRVIAQLKTSAAPHR